MKIENHDLKKPMTKPNDDVVTIVRDDGKEIDIKREMLAEHINRGFKVKHKGDQPTEDELRSAIGFNDAINASEAQVELEDKRVEEDRLKEEKEAEQEPADQHRSVGAKTASKKTTTPEEKAKKATR